MALRITSSQLENRGGFALKPAVVVLLVSLAHLGLLALVSRGAAPRPAIAPPVALAVRWVEAAQPVPVPAPAPVVPPPKPVARILHTTPMPRPAPAPAPNLAIAAVVPAAPAPVASHAVEAPPPPPVTPPSAAAYLSNPAPDYPAEAKRLRQEGQVMLRVLVTAEGQASQVQVETGSGFALLDQAAVAAVGKWRFTPGHQGDIPMEDWVLIPINFKLRTR